MLMYIARVNTMNISIALKETWWLKMVSGCTDLPAVNSK
jgi:hypothetical protein